MRSSRCDKLLCFVFFFKLKDSDKIGTRQDRNYQSFTNQQLINVFRKICHRKK